MIRKPRLIPVDMINFMYFRCATMTLRVFSGAPLLARPPFGSNQGRSTIELPNVLSIHVAIVPLSLHVNISATDAGKVQRFGATSDMLEVKLRRYVTESLGFAASRSHVQEIKYARGQWFG